MSDADCTPGREPCSVAASFSYFPCFLANVNSSSRSLYAVARPSVVCNARAPYSAGSNFPQYFTPFGTLAIR